MVSQQAAALARTVIFRRMRSILIRPHETGMIATTLNFDYQIRAAENAFSDIPKMKIAGEMLELAEHIIRTKAGRFDPKSFDDRYESALADLVKAKIEGRKIKPAKRPEPAKVVNLLDALRQSAKAGGRPPAEKRKTARKTAAKEQPQRKAG
jgi:DNA end-binding protein Ku